MAKKHAAKRKVTSAEKQEMVVVGSGDRPIEEVATDLKKAGFEVKQVLQGIGQVTGLAAPGLKARLKDIHGVADVSEAHEDFNIGPPDAAVS
jgi:hypothetical protein